MQLLECIRTGQTEKLLDRDGNRTFREKSFVVFIQILQIIVTRMFQ